MPSNQKLVRDDLWSLEQYSTRRERFRAEVIAHKKNRRAKLGPHATLYFEDVTTMRYQIQEMLRAERIFEQAEIEEELATYNPLIPDGSNWKATFMIEYGDAEERAIALNKMGGIEHNVWVQIADRDKVFAIANEDLERSRDTKAAAVHFLRFELDSATAQAAKSGATIQMGIDHEELPYAVQLPDNITQSLAQDLSA